MTAEQPPPLNEGQLLAALENLDDDDRTRLTDTFAALMSDQRARIEYAESRRGALATVGGVLLAAGLTGLLQVTRRDWDYFPARIGLLSLVLGLVITGTVVLWLWGRQTNPDYSFKAVSQTWKHFYRDALPGASEPKLPWHSGLSKHLRRVKEDQFMNGRAGFVERSLSLRDASISLAQDIEQAYLLHWNELYKNRFLTSLRQVLLAGVLASLFAAILGFGITAIFAGDYYDDARTIGGASTTTITTRSRIVTTHKGIVTTRTTRTTRTNK